MKKDGGYVLIYVLVALTLLAVLVLTVNSAALSNLKAQQAAVEDMQARYQAEGLLERLEAGLRGLEEPPGSSSFQYDTSGEAETEGLAAAKDDFAARFETLCGDLDIDCTADEPWGEKVSPPDGAAYYPYTAEVTGRAEQMEAAAELEIRVEIVVETQSHTEPVEEPPLEEEGGEPETRTYYTYSYGFSVADVLYRAYDLVPVASESEEAAS